MSLPRADNYLHCIYNYLHDIYTVLGIISNVDMIKNTWEGTSLVVRWLKLGAPNAEGTGSIPGQGTKLPHAKKILK